MKASQPRVAELQSLGSAFAEVTIASLVGELDEARIEVLRLGQTSAAVAATMGKVKITGQIVDRAEIGLPGEFDNFSEDQLREFIVSNLHKIGFSIQSSSAVT